MSARSREGGLDPDLIPDEPELPVPEAGTEEADPPPLLGPPIRLGEGVPADPEEPLAPEEAPVNPYPEPPNEPREPDEGSGIGDPGLVTSSSATMVTHLIERQTTNYLYNALTNPLGVTHAKSK